MNFDEALRMATESGQSQEEYEFEVWLRPHGEEAVKAWTTRGTKMPHAFAMDIVAAHIHRYGSIGEVIIRKTSSEFDAKEAS